jgi:hypothetical protein
MHIHPIVLGFKERCLLQTKRTLSPGVCADPSAASTRRRCRSRFEPDDCPARALGRTVMAPCSPCILLPHVVGRVHLWRLHLVSSVALEILQLRECLHYREVRAQDLPGRLKGCGIRRLFECHPQLFLTLWVRPRRSRPGPTTTLLPARKALGPRHYRSSRTCVPCMCPWSAPPQGVELHIVYVYVLARSGRDLAGRAAEVR